MNVLIKVYKVPGNSLDIYRRVAFKTPRTSTEGYRGELDDVNLT